MRIKVSLCKNNFKVPLAYQSILQGVIYSLLSKDDIGNFYHNEGYSYNQKTFKCFTFSQLFGKYTVKNNCLYFVDQFYFYISSQDEKFIEIIYKTLIQNNTLKIGSEIVEIMNVDMLTLKSFSGIKEVVIQTLSPMLIYSTKNNYSTYYRPSDDKSEEFIINNIKDKSMAYQYPIDEIVFQIKDVIFEKQRMVKFKNCFYRCYISKIKVAINFETLLFLYNCGISSKGSCGFGMIDVVNEKGHISL